MSSGRNTRAEVIASLEQALRRMGSLDVLFAQALVDRLGINLTDFICLSILEATGPMTAGRLAELTGLTSGAVTGVVDRLEKSGYARRTKDPNDRRVVIIEAARERRKQFDALLGPFGEAMRRVFNELTVEQLGTVTSFIQKLSTVLHEETGRLRTPVAAEAGAADGSWAPLGNATEGRLRFNSGAAKVTVRSDPHLSDELYRARFEGRPPNVKVDGGNVTVAYTRVGLFEWRKVAVDLALNTTLPWRLEFRGGVSRVDAKLAEAKISGLELTGGVMEVTALLPRPSGIVPVVITGGAANVLLERPRGAAVRVEIKGGVGSVELDDQTFGGIGGHATLTSPGAAGAKDRYDIEVSGGASNVVIKAA